VDDTLAEDDVPGVRPLRPGTKVGVYRVERVLGEGAMGWVYAATHESLGREVAIKALKPKAKADPSMVERFLAEARAVNIIRHENIVECTDTLSEAGDAFVVMELLDGVTLREATARGALPPGRAVRIAIQIARAIGAAHDKDIVHRDLKPENVFLIHRGDNPDYVKVLDFGIARLRPELGYVTATQTGALLGTPAYMSPEQVRGERATAASDIYALGIILFELIAGQLPFAATNIGTMFAAQLTETPARLDAIARGTPKRLADLVARMLAKNADHRPASMAEVERALGEQLPAAEAATVRAPPRPTVDVEAATVASGSEPSATRSRRWIAIPIAGAAIAGGVWWWSSRGPAIDSRDAGIVATAADAPVLALATDAPAALVVDAVASIDTTATVRAVDATVDARDVTARRPAVRDAAPTRPPPTNDEISHDRGLYVANTKAVIKSRYARDLETCWAIQHKVEPGTPRKKPIRIDLAIHGDGRVVRGTTTIAAVDNPPHGFDLHDCLEKHIAMWFFLPYAFEQTGDLELAIPFMLQY